MPSSSHHESDDVSPPTPAAILSLALRSPSETKRVAAWLRDGDDGRDNTYDNTSPHGNLTANVHPHTFAYHVLTTIREDLKRVREEVESDAMLVKQQRKAREGCGVSAVSNSRIGGAGNNKAKKR